jgi:hypothetical protein
VVVVVNWYLMMTVHLLESVLKTSAVLLGLHVVLLACFQRLLLFFWDFMLPPIVMFSLPVLKTPAVLLGLHVAPFYVLLVLHDRFGIHPPLSGDAFERYTRFQEVN